MDSLLTLSKVEQEFRRFYEQTGLHTMDRAVTAEEFERQVREAGPGFSRLGREQESFLASDRLAESTFFYEREDVAAVQHYRFMPAVYHENGFFEFECVLSGEVICYIGEKRMILEEGDVLILAPQTSHAACVYREDGIMVNLLVRRSTFEERFMNILPEGSLLSAFFEKALFQTTATPYLLFRTRDPGFLLAHIPGILAECRHNSRYRNTAMISLLQWFSVNLLRKHEKDVIIPGIRDPRMNEDTIFMLEYMQSNIATITLSHLASFFNYSERQIQRRIKDATGKTFVENIRELRMKRAAELLRNTDATVADIADYLGFYDVSSFRHAFRAYFGVAPNAYRG